MRCVIAYNGEEGESNDGVIYPSLDVTAIREVLSPLDMHISVIEGDVIAASPLQT